MKGGFTSKAKLTLKIKHQSADNPILIQEEPLHEVKVGIWFAVIATRLTRLAFTNNTFRKTVSTNVLSQLELCNKMFTMHFR